MIDVLPALLLAAGVATPRQADVPRGWIALGTPPTQQERSYCAFQYPMRRVFPLGRGIDIAEQQPQGERRDPLPFVLPPKVATGHRGDRLVYPARGGWVVGFDDGEFGGGIWWLGEGGKNATQLSGDNVIGLIPSADGLLILTGLSHLGASRGRLLLLPAGGDEPALRVLAELPGAPYAYDVPAPADIITATTGGVIRVNQSGNVQYLSRSRELPHPHSLVVAENGTIFVGMLHYVLMLVPESGTYAEVWLVPQGCRVLKYLGPKAEGRCACEK